MRIIFMGTSDFAVAVLEELVRKNQEIIAVYSQPAKRSGRGKRERDSPVAVFAKQKELRLYTPSDLKTAHTVEQFKELRCDLAVVVSYGILLPKTIIDSTKYGCFNVHASVLPRWRGAAPIQRALLANDTKTGVCLIKMDENLDTGPIGLMQEIAIGPEDNFGSLHTKLSIIGAGLASRLCKSFGTVRFSKQPLDGVKYAKKISKVETQINWNDDAMKVHAKVRAFSPYPGAWFDLEGERIKILLSKIGYQKGRPGEVLNSKLEIACLSGSICPVLVRRAGRSTMSIDDFLRGFTIKVGTLL